MSLSKRELIDAVHVSLKGRLNKAEIESVMDAFSGVVIKEVASGKEVTLPNIGKLFVDKRAERGGRNPKTGEKIVIPAARVPKFRPLKALKDAVAE